jgi:antitoxin YefM
MVSAEEWESMQETLFWLSQPRIHEDLAQAEDDIVAGRVYDEAQVRQALNLPTRR